MVHPALEYLEILLLCNPCTIVQASRQGVCSCRVVWMQWLNSLVEGKVEFLISTSNWVACRCLYCVFVIVRGCFQNVKMIIGSSNLIWRGWAFRQWVARGLQLAEVGVGGLLSWLYHIITSSQLLKDGRVFVREILIRLTHSIVRITLDFRLVHRVVSYFARYHVHYLLSWLRLIYPIVF